MKADLPDVNEKDIDVRVENNLLTIRGERKFEKSVSEDNYLRIERTYGSFSRSFSLPNTVNAEAIRAEYKNGVLTVNLPKREESKPRQVKVNVNAVRNGQVSLDTSAAIASSHRMYACKLPRGRWQAGPLALCRTFGKEGKSK